MSHSTDLLTKPSTIALVGNPNTGKSTIFNALTGLRQKIANYPGITVERKMGTTIINGILHKVIDLPGAYSLNHKKADERITYETLIGSYDHEETPDLLLMVVDASNLDRNLFLASQVMDLQIPMMMILTMNDVASDRGIDVNSTLLSEQLGIPVITLNARAKDTSDRIKKALTQFGVAVPKTFLWNPSEPLRDAIDSIVQQWLSPFTDLPERARPIEALRLLAEGSLDEVYYSYQEESLGRKLILQLQNQLEERGENPMAAEVIQRYQFIGDATHGIVEQESREERTWTDRLDAVFTHRVAGPILFLLVLLVMFQSIFSWATPFMDMIDLLFVELGMFVGNLLPQGLLNSLIVDGVIAGLGGVVIFLPQIIFLFLFIYFLEGTGYMARAAFVMDGFMTKVGLHGRSVVPLMSGFACAIPGIMATRTIENWRDRLITIMILPFMACSARLPVYAVMIAAFVPDHRILGIFTLQGVVFFGLYLFGIVMAIGSAAVMKRIFPTGKPTPFLMELPPYKWPNWSSTILQSFERGKIFVTEAGKIIVAISIVLWFLASFPKYEGTSDQVSEVQETGTELSESTIQLNQSYAGRFGQWIEPAIEPLGFDWKIGIGLLTSFAAREVMVGTLNTIYSIEETEDQMGLIERLRTEMDPETGLPKYNLATALSLMIFFAIAMQCMSTLAIVKRETNTWKWPLIMFAYMTVLAYVMAWITYELSAKYLLVS
jgi:ferrous iron transport protein B